MNQPGKWKRKLVDSGIIATCHADLNIYNPQSDGKDHDQNRHEDTLNV